MSEFEGLIGPKPVQTGPLHPLPWVAVGPRVYDADQTEVAAAGTTNPEKRRNLARAIVEAINAHFTPVPVLRSFRRKSTAGGLSFEVEQGWVVFAPSREQAEREYAAQSQPRTYGQEIGTYFLSRNEQIEPKPVLRDLKDRDGDAWFEVAPGQMLSASTRTRAERRFAENPRAASDIATYPAYRPFVDVVTGRTIKQDRP